MLLTVVRILNIKKNDFCRETCECYLIRKKIFKHSTEFLTLPKITCGNSYVPTNQISVVCFTMELAISSLFASRLDHYSAFLSSVSSKRNIIRRTFVISRMFLRKPFSCRNAFMAYEPLFFSMKKCGHSNRIS